MITISTEKHRGIDMIKTETLHGMTTIEKPDSFIVSYVDNMYKSGDGVAYQHDFDQEKADKVLGICDKIHCLVQQLEEIE